MLDALLSAALDRARDGAVVVLSVPAPDAPVERLLRAVPEGPATLLAPHHGRVGLAGRGRALHLTAPSLRQLREPLVASLARVAVIAAPGADGVARALGGQTFDPRHPAADEAWRTFPAASLTLPRWTLARVDGRTSLQVAFTRDDAPTAASVAAVLHSLEAPLPAPHVPRVTCLAGDRDDWEALVRDALAVMRDGRAEKLVGARPAALRATAPWCVADVIDRLDVADGCARFAFEHGDATFLGASPERLVSRRGEAVSADALAGSLPRGLDVVHDARALLDSAKDRREHDLVVTGIRAALREFCDGFEVPDAPVVRTLPRVHHLWTPVRARLLAGAHLLDLVGAMHPTPALGGAPRDVALDWIAQRERHPRGWYAAPVGWCDAAGDGEFFVAIRSAVLRGERAWTYAGAGLVPGSDPAREWDETEAKMSAMRAALGAFDR
jgi:isochorismate synthase